MEPLRGLSISEAKFVLELHSGATADGLSIVEPIAGSPIAGYPDARWVRLNSSSAAYSIIYRPGVDSADGAVATWAEVANAIEAADGLITVYIDNSHAPATVPAGTVTQCYSRVTFAPFNYPSVSGIILEIEDGAQLVNPSTFRQVAVAGAPTTAIPIIDTVGIPIILREGAVAALLPGATLPLIELQVNQAQVAMFEAGNLDNSNAPGQPVVRIASGATCLIVNIAAVGSFFPETAIEGDATATMLLLYDASYFPPATWTNFLGTVAAIPFNYARSLLPFSGTTGDRPSAPATGTMYFDTTLSIPVWWNGGGWVDATGAPA